MRILGATKLRNFPVRPRTVFDTYYDFEQKKEVPNFQIPPIGRSIRVTDLDGNPICIGRRKVQRGRFRLVYSKIDFITQRQKAFEMLDLCFEILTQVRIIYFCPLISTNSIEKIRRLKNPFLYPVQTTTSHFDTEMTSKAETLVASLTCGSF